VPLVRLSYGGWREWLSVPERSLLFATLREEESRLVKFPGRSAVCWPVPFFLEVQLHDVRPGPLLLSSAASYCSILSSATAAPLGLDFICPKASTKESDPESS